MHVHQSFVVIRGRRQSDSGRSSSLLMIGIVFLRRRFWAGGNEMRTDSLSAEILSPYPLIMFVTMMISTTRETCSTHNCIMQFVSSSLTNRDHSHSMSACRPGQARGESAANQRAADFPLQRTVTAKVASCRLPAALLMVVIMKR